MVGVLESIEWRGSSSAFCYTSLVKYIVHTFSNATLLSKRTYSIIRVNLRTTAVYIVEDQEKAHNLKGLALLFMLFMVQSNLPVLVREHNIFFTYLLPTTIRYELADVIRIVVYTSQRNISSWKSKRVDRSRRLLAALTISSNRRFESDCWFK